MITTIALHEEIGEFMYADNGSTSKYVFIGDHKFLERMTNFIYNFGVMEHKKTLEVEKIYISFQCTKISFLTTLYNYYYGYVYLNNKDLIDYKCEYLNKNEENEQIIISHDEKKLKNLAWEKAEHFFLNKMINEPAIINQYSSTEPINDFRFSQEGAYFDKEIEKEDFDIIIFHEKLPILQEKIAINI